jgi:hypothetical protein
MSTKEWDASAPPSAHMIDSRTSDKPLLPPATTTNCAAYTALLALLVVCSVPHSSDTVIQWCLYPLQPQELHVEE